MKGLEITLRKADGLKLASLMKQKGIDYEDIQNDLKIYPSQLSAILKGNSNYTIDTLNRLKVYLGVITERDIKEAKEILTNSL